MIRNGYGEEEARLRLAAQMPIEDKAARADIVIYNGGTLEETRRLLDGLWEDLLRREREKGKNKRIKLLFWNGGIQHDREERPDRLQCTGP